MQELLSYAVGQALAFATAISQPLPFFVILAVLTKGRRVFADVKRAVPEVNVALLMLLVDSLLFAPILIAVTLGMHAVANAVSWMLVPPSIWAPLPPVVVGFVAVFVGDLVGYWRHRIEHTPLLWPSHAVHHSDTAMTWFAIFRFHPINRLSTLVLDNVVLLACGLPPYAIFVNVMVRHYYGAYIHADLPWTYGALGKVFVSPAMHRWHHAMDKEAFQTNFAVVFSFIDLAFGTYRVPGPCTVPLGVVGPMKSGFIGQYLHPLRPSSYSWLLQSIVRRRRGSERTDTEGDSQLRPVDPGSSVLPAAYTKSSGQS